MKARELQTLGIPRGMRYGRPCRPRPWRPPQDLLHARRRRGIGLGERPRGRRSLMVLVGAVLDVPSDRLQVLPEAGRSVTSGEEKQPQHPHHRGTPQQPRSPPKGYRQTHRGTLLRGEASRGLRAIPKPARLPASSWLGMEARTVTSALAVSTTCSGFARFRPWRQPNHKEWRRPHPRSPRRPGRRRGLDQS